MDIKTFKQRCESVILVNELPSLSLLRRKVVGCYAVFGMCPVGEVVTLDMGGNVNCLKAEIDSVTHLCAEKNSPCRLEAAPIKNLEVINLLSNFLVENFITKEGILAKKDERKGSRQGAGHLARMEKAIAGMDYTDEDFGISHHLPETEKRKRRHAAEKSQGRILNI